jgi:hypothetical protein
MKAITSAPTLSKKVFMKSTIKHSLFKYNQKNKKPLASKYIINFLTEIFQQNNRELENQFARSIYDLDSLAVNIDSLLDIDSASNMDTVKDIKIKNNLDERIFNTLSNLRDIPNFNLLVEQTMKRVDQSIYLNTLGRKNVYSLDNNQNDSFLSTSLYLVPLITFFSDSFDKSKTERTVSLFILLSNYIQILDDLKDLYQDINQGNHTPITEKYLVLSSAIENKNFNHFEYEFCFLVINKLSIIFSKVKNEFFILQQSETPTSYIQEIDLFQVFLENYLRQKNKDNFKIEDFLKYTYKKIPIIVCYAN